MPEQLRLFVACELPDGAREALRRVQEDLGRRCGDRLRLVRPEGIHLTLKFLGAVERARLGEITAALSSAVEPFELVLRPSRVGGFGGARLRVVWVGLEGDVEATAALAARIDATLEPLGFPRERRRFASHLTLARVPDDMSTTARQELATLIDRYEPAPLPEVVLRCVSLIKSTLGRGPATYDRLAEFP